MLTMPSLLARTVAMHGRRTAVLDDDLRIDWSGFQDRVARAATVLNRLGLRPGQAWGILARNSFRQAELLQAGYQAGFLPVPVNFRLAPREIAFILQDAGCRLLVVEDHFAHMLDTPELEPWREHVLHLSAGPAEVTWPQYDAMLAEAPPSRPMDVSEDAPALLLYTGGTTGRPKGVALTHRNIAANALQIAAAFGSDPDHRYLHLAPMFHAAELVSNAFLVSGAAHAYVSGGDVVELLKVIRRQGITAAMLPPVMIIKAIQMIEADPGAYDLGSFRHLLFGSSPMPLEWIRRTLVTFGCADIWHGYGLTETSPIITLAKLDRSWLDSGHPNADRLSSAGQPVIGAEIRITDVNGMELPPGGVGEVLVRGPQVASGYLNLPDESAQAFENGWFKTGDVGRLDDEAYLTLLDRKKDMVITGGENVYTVEVETALCRHPKIQDAAVFGIPDEVFGEALFAAIVPHPGQRLDADEVIAHCRKFIGGYKVPRRIAVLDELPRSAVGKVQKDKLRRRFCPQEAIPETKKEDAS